MRLNIKNISLFAWLIILVIVLTILLFFETDINITFIYLVMAGIITVVGFLLLDYLSRERDTFPKQRLDLPSSTLNADPKIAFDDTINLICKQLRTIKPTFEFAIYLIDPESSSFIIQNKYNEQFTEAIDMNNDIFYKIFNEDQTILIKPNDSNTAWQELFLETETNNSNRILGAKIIYNTTPIGVLIAFADDVRRIETKDPKLIEQFANQVTASLKMIDTVEALQKHHTVMEKINSMIDSINISESKSIIYENVVDVCQTLFRYNKLTVMVGHNDVDHARIEYIDGYSLDISPNDVFPLNNSIFNQVLVDRESINSNNIKKDFGKKYRFFVDEHTRRNVKSMLAYPITIDQDVTGCIAIERFDDQKYSDINEFYFQKIADKLSILLRWQSQFSEMYMNTTHDNLTGLLNYRAFLNRLDVEMNRALRTEHSLVIVIIDVDKFKRINDTLGHEVGNIALKKIAELISSSIRTIDIAARYGGEEFIAVLSNADMKKAEQIASRIVSNIANNIFIFEGQKIRITVSAGLAEFPKNSDQVQKLIDIADKAMYSAKRKGGNTYCLN